MESAPGQPPDGADGRAGDLPALRWIVGTVLVLYGFAKLNGAQFLTLESQLDRPLGEVSGFWLTWSFFGRSDLVRWTIALTEIVGGLLLTSRRLYVVGALVVLPVLTTIVLIDVGFGVDIGATILAALLLLGTVVVLWPHARRLLGAALLQSRPASGRAAIAARVGIVGLAFILAHTVRTRVVQAPTPIDGVWDVTAAAGEFGAVDRVFFERNRAHMAVFRDTTGAYATRHFELQGDSVRVWRAWLEPDSLLLYGTWSADTIALRSPDRGAALRLERSASP